MDWVQLLLPVADFLRLVIPRFKEDQHARTADRMRLVSALAAGAARFGQQQPQRPPNHDRLTSSLQMLDRSGPVRWPLH